MANLTLWIIIFTNIFVCVFLLIQLMIRKEVLESKTE